MAEQAEGLTAFWCRYVKKTPDPIIGTTIDDDGEHIVTIDVDRLIETRLVVTAISGGGKSHTVRRILEQTQGKVQHLIIDPEGEFYTLREKFPYLLAGRNGDCPAEVRSAGLLATKLLELRTSAILDIYGLTSDPNSPNNRAHFVKAFLDALLNADQRLFHPCIVVIDEAHKYCPEKGEGESVATGSVINLMADGRKKHLCGILATQRISKLHKSAVSEAHNMMIGKSTLDVDVTRAMKNLGFKTGRENEIRRLKKGHFWTYGPALTDEVADVLVADTLTRSPKLGARMTKPAPPSGAIQKILKQLADIPEEVAKKEQTEKDLRAEIAELKKSLRTAPAIKFAQPLPVEKTVTKIIEKWAISSKQMKGVENFVKRLAMLTNTIDAKGDLLVEIGRSVRESLLEVREAISSPIQPPKLPGGPLGRRFVDVRPIVEQQKTNLRVQTTAAEEKKAVAVVAAQNGDLVAPVKGSGRKILTALAQYPQGRSMIQVAALIGSKLHGSYFAELTALRKNGFIEGPGSGMTITPTGLNFLGPFEPLPVGEELREMWLSKIGADNVRGKILKCLIEHHPETMTQEELAASIGSKLHGTFFAALTEFRKLELITGGGKALRASDSFFQD